MRWDDGTAWMAMAWLLIGAVVLALVGILVDWAGGQPDLVAGISGESVHHDAWTEHRAAYWTSTGGKHPTRIYHPARTIRHEAYDETPIGHIHGCTWIRAAYPRGLRFLVPQTVGKLTGWRYSDGTPYLEPAAEQP